MPASNVSTRGNLWGGRFRHAPDAAFDAFQRSLPFDQRLWPQDIEASVAWAEALVAARVLTDHEGQRLRDALGQLHDDLARDETPLESSEAEDIHTFVEHALADRVGELARKLHTGRSRNDQVATDLRLWSREAGQRLIDAAEQAMEALVDVADANADLPLPGYTHLQRGQPVTVGHHALAFVEMLGRDCGRLRDALRRMDVCPLGCGALAGTAIPVDRSVLAAQLGFSQPSNNSLDAVSDRDFVADLLFACSMIQVHLSRLVEDWIFYCSHEAGFLRLADTVTTGSSLMPQKKNPDGLELIRGKTGRVLGHLNAMLVTLKGLPLAYDKDLQEDKETLFDAIDQTLACLTMTALIARNAHFDATRCRDAADRGWMNATDLADLLVAVGVPFRDAHERAGHVVLQAAGNNVELQDLPAETWDTLLPELADTDPRAHLGTDAVLARRSAIGGSAPARVREQIVRWRAELESSRRNPEGSP